MRCLEKQETMLQERLLIRLQKYWACLIREVTRPVTQAGGEDALEKMSKAGAEIV